MIPNTEEPQDVYTITITNNYRSSGGDNGGGNGDNGGGGSGGNGGGPPPPNINTTPPPNTVDQNIPDLDTPLSDYPPPVIDEDLELDEPPVPLGDMPQTDVQDRTRLLVYGVLASLFAISILTRLVVRLKKENQAR